MRGILLVAVLLSAGCSFEDLSSGFKKHAGEFIDGRIDHVAKKHVAPAIRRGGAAVADSLEQTGDTKAAQAFEAYAETFEDGPEAEVVPFEPMAPTPYPAPQQPRPAPSAAPSSPVYQSPPIRRWRIFRR